MHFFKSISRIKVHISYTNYFVFIYLPIHRHIESQNYFSRMFDLVEITIEIVVVNKIK